MGNKIIRITTENQLSIHDCPETNEGFHALIGCDIYQRVRPKRLYHIRGVSVAPSAKCPGKCLSMLVDEEGLLKPNFKYNPVGCWLYETDKHHSPIVGDILIVGETVSSMGEYMFCGIDDSIFFDFTRTMKTLCEKAISFVEMKGEQQ